jgi:hypothetical protein
MVINNNIIGRAYYNSLGFHNKTKPAISGKSLDQMIFKLTLNLRVVRAFVKHAVEGVHLAFDVSLPGIVAKRAGVNRGFSRLFCFGAFPSFEKLDVAFGQRVIVFNRADDKPGNVLNFLAPVGK